MRSEGKRYFLKEYGSWTVLIVSYSAGLSVSREWSWAAVPLFLALALLINSKQAFMQWVRRKEDRHALSVFLLHLLLSALILIAVFRSDIPRLLPLLLFPAAYMVFNRLAGEHFILTEVLGFTLIGLAAVLGKFLLTGGLDIRLFAAVTLYFTAGVFKIKALIRKRPGDRAFTGLSVVFAVLVYRGYYVPLIILLPLLDNLLVAAFPYSVKLRTTGLIEVVKSLLFLALLILFF